MVIVDVPAAAQSKKRKKRTRKPKSKEKKKRRKSPSSSSSSSEESENSTSDSETEANDNWSRINEIWEKESRPKFLQDRELVNKMTFMEIFQIHTMHAANEKAATKGAALKQDDFPEKVRFPAGKDDGLKKLHAARFLRLPFSDPKDYYSQVPTKHSKRFRNISLEFSGCANEVSDKSILLLHDQRNAVELKHFLAENLNVASRPLKFSQRKEEDSLVSSSDYSWDEASSMRQVLSGIKNYRSCLHHLWLVDQTGDIIGKLLLKYRHIAVTSDQKTRVAVVTSYFNHVQRANAKRVANKAVVLSFEDHEKVLKDTLISFGLRSEVPYDHQMRDGRADTGPGPSGTQTQRGRQQKREFPPKTPGGLKICYDYNNDGCSRKKTETGCVGQKGELFSHLCNRWDQVKKVNCHGRHARPDHK